MLETIARSLIVFGLVLVIAGVTLYVLAKLNLPLGRLPGDVRIEGKGFVVYVPLVSMLLLSLLLTVVLNLLARLFK